MNWKILFTKPNQEAVQKGQVLFLENDLIDADCLVSYGTQ